jgi:hypothetical protein
MEIEDVVASMRGYLKDSTVEDFVMLSRLFKNPRFHLLIKKVLDLESRTLLSAAKNGELLQNVVEWCEREKKVKSSTLSDRKRYLMKLGLMSEEVIRPDKPARGRPKKRLIMTEENRRRFEEYFGESINSFLR